MNKHLKNCLDNFDFDRVKKTMDALDWVWVDGPITIKKMKKTVAYLYKSCKNNLKRSGHDTLTHATGGFQVRVEVNEHRKVDYVGVSFIVSDWDSYDEAINNP